MSHRIFVNIQNQKYKEIVQNGQGAQFGLGIPTELTEQERIDLEQKAYEIYFSVDDLRDKQRKIKILFNSLTDPKFFGDGAVNITKVQKYLTDLELELKNKQVSTDTTGFLLNAGTAITNVFGTQATAITGLVVGAAVPGGLSTGAVLAGTLGALPIGGVVLALGSIFRGIASTRQAGREDNAAPWLMTQADFPNITTQAIAGRSNRRSIERLYDDRGGLKTFDVSTREAIALLVRETLADALYCTSVPGGFGRTPSEHPGPGGNASSKDALKRHFLLIKHETSGADKAERTYVNVLVILKRYIDLIDAILNLQDPSLSRSPDVEQALISIPLEIRLRTVNVQLFDTIIETARQVVREKVLTFFDKDREYKTLLNFGNDRQYVAEAWRLAPKSTGSVQLKLNTPLDADINVETRAFISREIAESVIDVINFELAPPIDTTPYLRPANADVRNYVNSKMLATNVTLKNLGLITGSVGTIINDTTITYEDLVFRRWFTGDFKSSELNINFTDYSNFVHFGSAYKRLQTFSQKLEKIEELTSASISSSVSSSTVSIFLKAQEKEEIIRNFDPYEQFLYYATASLPYSASVFYTTDAIEYNATGSWPKQNDGTVYSPYSTVAANWLDNQIPIAQRYDSNNPNYLVVNLPKYIQEDDQSTEFLTLFDMVGHLMDNIKVYIDQFPNIYLTNIDPLQGLSMDQVYEVARSFGLKLPNVYALESLQTFNAQFSGESGSRTYVAETWKRFLHSMVYLAKTKGSRTSFDALLNTYGINSPVLQLKETTHPLAGNYIQSDELTYGLRFTGSVENFIKLPFVSSSLTASTIQLSFNPILRESSSLITAENWGIDLIPHPSGGSSIPQYIDGTYIKFNDANTLKYGRLEVVSGSNRDLVASSSYFPLFGNDYTNLMLRSQSNDMVIIQTDGEQILYQTSVSTNLSSLWNDTVNIYVGGSGSLKLSNNFDGIVDEIRVWGENISYENFIKQAYDPGSYYGVNYTSSYNNLYVHVPLSQPLAAVTESVHNESPYLNVATVQTLPAQGFTTASFTRILRTIKQFSPIIGSTIYTNKKITIAEPPVFNGHFIDGNGTKILSPNISIKRVEEKQYNSGKNIVSFAVSPTNFINQDIIRSMGVIDVNNVIGSPRYIVDNGYTSLQAIQNDYLKYFNKTVNPNEYTRFFKDLTQGPSEMADEMVPARAKLMDGIVIESSILARNKDRVIRKISADGTATKTLLAYISGSGSTNVGAYDFNIPIQIISLLPNSLGYTTPIDAKITIPDTFDFKESTKSSRLPTQQRVIQRVGQYYVTSSILDQNSSYSTLETIIDTETSTATVSPGYARNPYYGIPSSGSVVQRLPGEENTLTPFYEIPPRSDLTEVGTTSYFHKINGIYSYDIYSKYKVEYLVKLDTDVDSPLDRLYAPITLLSSSTIPNAPGRDTVTIPLTSYTANTTGTTGVIKAANIFSLYGIIGPSGLRIRLYRNSDDLTSDITRNFNTTPNINSGVLFDVVLNGSSDVFPYTMIQTENSAVYYNIENITTDTITTLIELEYFAYEPANLLPIGYLPRHYKFSRENGTALKRRNYIGCRTVSTIFDEESPIIITISGTNTTVVNSTVTDTQGPESIILPIQGGIIFGGGGLLDVS